MHYLLRVLVSVASGYIQGAERATFILTDDGTQLMGYTINCK